MVINGLATKHPYLYRKARGQRGPAMALAPLSNTFGPDAKHLAISRPHLQRKAHPHVSMDAKRLPALPITSQAQT